MKASILSQKNEISDEAIIIFLDTNIPIWKNKLKELSGEIRKFSENLIDPTRINEQRIYSDSQRAMITSQALDVIPSLRKATYFRDRMYYAVRREFEINGRDGRGPEPNVSDKDLDRWLKQHPIIQKAKSLVEYMESFSEYSRELAKMHESRLFTLRDIANYLSISTGQL